MQGLRLNFDRWLMCDLLSVRPVDIVVDIMGAGVRVPIVQDGYSDPVVKVELLVPGAQGQFD